jgi:hypothetical protein
VLALEAGTGGQHFEAIVVVVRVTCAQLVGTANGDVLSSEHADELAIHGPRALGFTLPGVPKLADGHSLGHAE